MIAEGLSSKMIANKLDIAESMVKVHVKHRLNKTGLRTQIGAAVWTVSNLVK